MMHYVHTFPAAFFPLRVPPRAKGADFRAYNRTVIQLAHQVRARLRWYAMRAPSPVRLSLFLLAALQLSSCIKQHVQLVRT